MKLINIGFGNMVSANRLIAIVSPESAPIKRIVQEARDKGVLIDATYGRRTRAVEEMEYAVDYNEVVINDTVDECAEEIYGLIQKYQQEEE